jgi:hypothetical protein
MLTLTQALNNITQARIISHIMALQGVRHPVFAPHALEEAGDYIFNELQALGCTPARHEFETDDRIFSNVIATQTGSLFPQERIIILAHYDTVKGSPGADDNASGIAGLLELAAVLQPFSFKRTLQFIAVNLEEKKEEDEPISPATRGSYFLASDASEKGWDICAVFVLECIGYAGEAVPQSLPPGLSIPLPDTGNFIAAIANERSADLVQALKGAVQRHQIALPLFPLIVPGNGELIPATRRSDHAPFWDFGFKAAMLTDTANFRNPHYHQPGDTLDTLNLDFIRLVCQMVGGAAAALADA